jgi:hypothetical protein
MSEKRLGEEAIAVVKRNTELVQGKGDFEAFEKLFAEKITHRSQARPLIGTGASAL